MEDIEEKNEVQENNFSGEGVSNSKKKITERVRENPWILATFVLGIVVVLLMFGNGFGKVTGNVVSGDKAAEDLISYLNTIADSDIELVDVSEVNGLYEVVVDYEGERFPIYVTKDGGSYTPSLIPISSSSSSSSSSSGAEVPKSDVPVVELFVMTHCPYGTQAEKGFIPMMNAMGDLIQAEIKFVHYFMHEPEETETPIEVCIREEQEDKFIDYLTCFLEGNGVVDPNYGLIMEGRDSEECMREVGVDVQKVNDCVSSGKWEDYYAEDSALSQGYGVQGSPTLVVNGEIVSSGRSASAYLDTVCQAFNNVPSECGSLTLDSTTPSPYFGWDSSGSATTAQC